MSYDLGTARGKIELEYDGGGGADRAARDMDRLSDKSKDTDDKLKKLGSTLGSFGKGAGITGLAVGMTNAAVQAAALGIQVLGIVPNLASLASLASIIPGALAAGAAAAGVFASITAGMEETLSAAMDPSKAKEFAAALEKLPPSAQKFALAFRDAVPGVRGVGKAIQEAFFSAGGFDTIIERGASMIKALRPDLQNMAADFGAVGREIGDFATSKETFNFLRESIASFRTGLQGASKGITPLLTGLRDVGGVGNQLMERLGAAVGRVATQFGNWLSEIAKSGQLQAWIDQAIVTLKQLGGILGNVGSILTSVFQAANATGGGLLGILQEATGQMAAFLKSAEGSAALRELFTGILTVAQQLAPVFTTLFGALANALGPALMQLATQVGPVLLQVVEALAPAFGPLLAAVASLAGAIAPLLPPAGQLIALLAQLASGVVQTLVAALGPLVAVVGGALSDAFAKLSPVISQLVSSLAPLAAQLGPQLAAAFQQLVPPLMQLVGAFADGLIAYLPQAIGLLQQVIPVAIQLATTFATLLGPILSLAATIIGPLFSALGGIVGFLTPIIGVIASVVSAFLRFLASVVNLPGQVSSIFSSIGSAISGAWNAVVAFIGNGINSIVAFFTALPGRIGSAIAALPGQVWNLIKNMATQAAFLFGAMIGTLVTLAVTLPPKILAAIRALPGQLGNLIRNAWNAARSLFVSGVAAAISIARTLPGRVASAIAALAGFLRSRAVAAWNALRGAFVSGIATAISLARSLPGRIVSAVGNLASLLLSAGRDAVQGLVNGIRNGIGAVGDAARALGSSVMNGIKSTLKISSPSKEMQRIGKFIDDGLVKGMLGNANQVKAASKKLGDLILDAFNDKKLKKGRRNAAMRILTARTKQFAALATRSEQIAGQLKAAQDKLANAQKAYDDTYKAAYEKTKQSFGLVTSGQEFVNLDLTKDRFKQAVAQAKTFADNIAKLTKRGLNKDLLQQLVDAGAADGGAMAAALAGANDATIKEFNSLAGQLDAQSKKVAKTTADAMYGAGLKAAQGLVAGLKAKEKALEAQMRILARSMVLEIKRALKIKSPSRVMVQLGEFTAEGLKDGIENLKRQVARAAQDLATASIIPTVRLTAGAVAGGGQNGRAVAYGGPGATSNNITQNVYALPGMSAQQVARYGFDKLRYALQGGITAVTLPAPSSAGA